MRKLILALFLFLSLNLFSQEINLAPLAGVWQWKDNITDSEFFVQLKAITYQRSIFFGGGIDSALVGGYKYKKNGVVLVDKLSEVLSTKLRGIEYPVWISKQTSLVVHDYLTKNGRGEFKYIGGLSNVKIVSLNDPKQIRWILKDNSEQVVVTFDDEDGDQYFFPDGTALPTNLVLTKIE